MSGLQRLKLLNYKITKLPISSASIRQQRDPRLVRGHDDRVSIDEQALAGIEGETGCSGGAHHLNCLHADDGHIETHVLPGLRNFDDG
jgi:hypothetical protein